MSERNINQGNRSVYVERNEGVIHIHNQVKEEIPHHLTSMPFFPDYFIGREAELKQIRTTLFSEEQHNLLLLVNGRGGVGKTTLASRYYHKHHELYAHVAWVLNEQSILDALLNLAYPLQVPKILKLPRAQAIEELLRIMASLPKPCLLVIDNANNLQDLKENYDRLKRCPNFHLLLTTRVNRLDGAQTFKIEGLPYDKALEVFENHYQKLNEEEQNIFKGIHKAVNKNTLIVEILAKNLAMVNEYDDEYSLAKLLEDLQNRGLLALSQSEGINLPYRQYVDTKPEDIIFEMYELSRLSEAEKALLSIFAVLPPEGISLKQLKDLLPSKENLKEELRSLEHKGWIEFSKDDKNFKCSPVVQEVVRKKNEERFADDIEELLKQLNEKLANDGSYLKSNDYKETAILVNFAEAILLNTGYNNVDIQNLCEKLGTYYDNIGQLEKALYYFNDYKNRSNNLIKKFSNEKSYVEHLTIAYERIGNIHKSLGNLTKALDFYEKVAKLRRELYNTYPENEGFKRGLAVSYFNLGDTQSLLGNLNKALDYFERYNELGKELYDFFPQNVNFKNGLAISYSKLGSTHFFLGNLNKALDYFERETLLFEELYDSNPRDVRFKSGLAISYEKLGDTHSTLGNLNKALEYFEEETVLFEELYESYPSNVRFKNGLAISYEKLGSTHSLLGDLKKALDYFEKYNGLTEELYASYSSNVSFKNGLAISYSRLGSTHSSLGNLNKALNFYEKDVALTQELYESYPSNVNFKSGLAISYEKLGSTHSSLGNLNKALNYFEEEIVLFKELYTSYPLNVRYKNGLAISYSKLGRFYRDHKADKGKATEYFQLCHDMWKEMSEEFPDYVEFKKNLDWVNNALKDNKKIQAKNIFRSILKRFKA